MRTVLEHFLGGATSSQARFAAPRQTRRGQPLAPRRFKAACAGRERDSPRAFAANDRTAENVLTVARMLNLSMPQDLSVIGVDNYASVCETTSPTLTSVEPDFRRAGASAAMMVLETTQAHSSAATDKRRVYGPLRVVRRASTRILARHDAEVAAALEMIEANACTALTAAQVVRIFPCSRVYAEMRFRRATGQSILEAIQSVRLERAKELLRNPNQQLKSIADFCGFKSLNALCKFFHKKTGMTMSAWRASACS